MKFLVGRTDLLSDSDIECSEEEFKFIQASSKILIETMIIEEKFDMVLENYVELENEILSLTTRYLVFWDQDIEWFHSSVGLINRRLVNLLSSCRLYLDQSVVHLMTIFGKKSPVIETVKNEKSRVYGVYQGFRIMEALRNYSQHRGLPVNSILCGPKELGGHHKTRYSIIPYLNVMALRHDPQFNQTIFKELEKIGIKVDLRPYIREYIEAIGVIHHFISHYYDERWERAVLQVFDRYKATYITFPNSHSLTLQVQHDDGLKYEVDTITNFPIRRRKDLQLKHLFTETLSSRFVSNEIDTIE